MITHEASDEGVGYLERLRSLANGLNVQILHVADIVGSDRGRSAAGNKLFSLWDAYPHADFVTYPSAASIAAQSSTHRASGPTVSNRAASGTTPFSDTRPDVVFNPTRSFHADGMRTDPPVSLPIPQAARFSAIIIIVKRNFSMAQC